jgi:DHA1 family multidrug resistance protein-like MFS transporter
MIYYRRNLLVLSVTTFIASAGWTQIMPFLPLFIQDLGVHDRLAFWSGMVMACQTIATIVMMPFWGKIADKYGRKLMIIRAGICLALIYLGMSLCQSLWQLLLLRVLNGVLTGFIPSSLTLVATNSPHSESARNVSVLQSTVAFGTIAGPPIGSVLAEIAGYRGSMVVSMVAVGLAVMLVAWLVEEREKAQASEQTSLWQDFRLAFRMPELLTAMLADMVTGLVTMTSQPILILHLQNLVGKAADAFCGPIFSLPGVAIVLMNYTWCRIGEKRTFQKVILFGLTGLGVVYLAQGFAYNIWLFAGLYFFSGVFAAAVSPNTAALVATKVNPDFQGRAFAIQQSSRNFGSMVGPLLAGVIGSCLNFHWLFIITGSIAVIAMFLIRLQMRTWTAAFSPRRAENRHEA